MIGDDIEVTVVDIRGEKVRLGFTAGNGVPIHRKEIWKRIKSQPPVAADNTKDGESCQQ